MEEHVRYQLEEKMGDGKWSRVYETKEESNYADSPVYLSFPTKEAAREYAQANGERGWRDDPIKRGVVRLVVVRTTVTVVE